MYFNKTLTDKELVMDLVSSEKQIASCYNNAIIESSCPVLRQIFTFCLSNTQNIQYSLYDAMERRGWNHVELVSSREIENMLEKYDDFY